MGKRLPVIFNHTAIIIACALLAIMMTVIVNIILYEKEGFCDICQKYTVKDIELWIRSLGMWGVFAVIGLMILHSFIPFPAEFIAMANGMVYGVVWGTLITWTGAMLGAWMAFGLARAMGRPFVCRMLPANKAQYVDDQIDNHGDGALLICRFIPVIVFNLINYAAGLTRISWWTFIWTTAIGILPLTTLMVMMGDQLDKLSLEVSLIIIIVILIIWLLVHQIFQKKSNQY